MDYGRVGMGMRNAWEQYCDHLVKRPLATKIATGVLGSALGDSIAQGAAYVSHRRKLGVTSSKFSFDFARTARLCTHAALLGTPINHAWFGLLDKNVFPSRMNHPLTALAKMGLDQAIMSPIGLCLFFMSVTLMEGRGLQRAVEVIQEKFVPTMTANYTLWPAAHLVNFTLVPPEQRILYCNVVAVGWISFLSTVASSGSPES